MPDRKIGKAIARFKAELAALRCPFCGDRMKYYDGLLGYEALRCRECRFEVDHNGMRFTEEVS